MVPSFRSFSFRTPQAQDSRSRALEGMSKWTTRLGKQVRPLASNCFFIPTVPSTIYHPNSQQDAATLSDIFPQARSAQALLSLSPHIPPLPSQAHWPHLHPHGGARGGSCHCDGWVCGSGPWTTPAACPVAGSTPRPCRDGRWWPRLPGLPPGQWETNTLIYMIYIDILNFIYTLILLFVGRSRGTVEDENISPRKCLETHQHFLTVLNTVKFRSSIVVKPCVRQSSQHQDGWSLHCWIVTEHQQTDSDIFWQPSRRDQSHSHHLLCHAVTTHHPTSQFQIDGGDRCIITIRWDHDAMVGGGSEWHGIINPQFAGRGVQVVHLQGNCTWTSKAKSILTLYCNWLLGTLVHMVEWHYLKHLQPQDGSSTHLSLNFVGSLQFQQLVGFLLFHLGHLYRSIICR